MSSAITVLRRAPHAFGMTRDAMRGHVTHAQLKVMDAIESCRTAARPCGAWLRHDAAMSRVARMRRAASRRSPISCRNRHCPKCQGSQAREWLEARMADLLPVPYFHVVFTLPPKIAAIAFHNTHALHQRRSPNPHSAC